MDVSFAAYERCMLCPRRCGARRTDGRAGVCGCTSALRVARAALHFWEEPPISGESGSGAIFFSGCPLRCIFCQNEKISHEGYGIEVTAERLATMMIELQAQGALNINLVTPLHFAPHLCVAIDLARADGLTLPIVCNTSGYETAELVHAMADRIDVWLTDFKYASSAVARRLSAAADYPQMASDALDAMLASLRRQGGRALNEDGTMLRGIIVRHLVLPGHVGDSMAVVDRVWEIAGNEVDLSIMNQYTPNKRCRSLSGPLAHGLDEDEYDLVVCRADEVGFQNIWWQEGGTVSESFVPDFDATGVLSTARR
ncbi:MAG: radical SAM protein [Atopobiaceae bacterium]|nr:radical SAM protein [Atopobiaceae bacterium]